MKKQQHDVQQIETTLADEALAFVIGGATGPVLTKTNGPIFPNGVVTFDYPKRDISNFRG